jgi:hypothetical protein
VEGTHLAAGRRRDGLFVTDGALKETKKLSPAAAAIFTC